MMMLRRCNNHNSPNQKVTKQSPHSSEANRAGKYGAKNRSNGRRFPVDIHLPERVDDPGHQAGAGERDQRVDAVDDERPRPALDLMDVDEPEASGQHHTGEAGREDDVAARPDVLVDGKEPVPHRSRYPAQPPPPLPSAPPPTHRP